MDYFYDPANWVAIATVLFVGVVVYLKVPAMVGEALDKRAKEIADELEAARRLRDEAQALLASYQRRTANAEKEVEEIVEQARAEAARHSRDMQAALAAQAERRSKMVEEKIAQAETQAIQEVRAAAVDAAVSAARTLISSQLNSEKERELIEQSISDVRGKLH
ncbi:MAG: F0F1 ATP synthase subunit B [Alphaproteobacteria bacterium]|nr:F0F1 ATP synthase subunit B [Alphaproteobacteria bacterium]MDP1671131.1 F0F1 ATP synthase subunit B [Alphaproteobacteria bacterium]